MLTKIYTCATIYTDEYKRGVTMPRKFPISAVIGLLFGGIALLIGLLWLFMKEVFGFILYIFLALFFGIEIFENVDLLYFTVIPIALVVFYILVSALTLFIWKFGSDRVYDAMKKVCDVFVTLLVAPWSLFAIWLPLISLVVYTREWIENHGDTPLYMVLLLVPIFFIFFSKVKLKINSTLGNTTLAVVFMPYALHTCRLGWHVVRYYNESFYDFTVAVWRFEYLTFFAAFSFIVLWLFEQMLRGEDAKLKPLSRLLLSGIAVLSSITVVIVCLPELCVGTWSWRQINTVLFATPIFALFAAYIVKVNRNKNNVN